MFSAHSRDTLWVLADRRLSYGPRYPPKDDGVKVMNLHCADGDGVLAYAGLGATRRGTQPSDWMSGVLRGHGDKSFEHNLRVLADAATKELPKHLASIPNPEQRAHFILAVAFVKGAAGARVYTIDNFIHPETGQHWFRYTSHVRSTEPGAPSPRFAGAGSGAQYVLNKYFRKEEGKAWQRELLRLLKAHDDGKVPTHRVADRLAELNYEVHKALGPNGDVGPRSVVVWCRREGARPNPGSSGHQFYKGDSRDPADVQIPNIYNGNDLREVIGVIAEPFLQWFSKGPNQGQFNPDIDAMNRALADIPSTPDEKLR